MEKEMKDIESPEPSTSADEKDDILSVDGTKSLNSASFHDCDDTDSGEAAVARNANNKKRKMITLLAVLFIVVGLAVGLGILLTGGSSSFGFVHCNRDKHHADSASGVGGGDGVSSSDSLDTIENEVPEVPGAPEGPEPPAGPKYPIEGDKTGKTQWPELVDMPSAEAVVLLRQWYGDTYHIMVVLEGEILTMEFRTDRIIVFEDENGIVTKTPRVG